MGIATINALSCVYLSLILFWCLMLPCSHWRQFLLTWFVLQLGPCVCGLAKVCVCTFYFPDQVLAAEELCVLCFSMKPLMCLCTCVALNKIFWAYCVWSVHQSTNCNLTCNFASIRYSDHIWYARGLGQAVSDYISFYHLITLTLDVRPEVQYATNIPCLKKNVSCMFTSFLSSTWRK